MTTEEHINEMVMLGPDNDSKKIVLDAGAAGTFEVAGVGVLSDGRVCIYAGAED